MYQPNCILLYSVYSPILNNYYAKFADTDKLYKDKVKMWWFNISVYEPFVSGLQSHDYNDKVYVDEIPSFLIQGIQSYTDNIRALRSKPLAQLQSGAGVSDVYTRINQNLLDILLPYQLEGIQFIVNRGGRGLIGDEMGCGKTVQAIGCIQYYCNHWPVLILVPPSLAFQW